MSLKGQSSIAVIQDSFQSLTEDYKRINRAAKKIMIPWLKIDNRN